VTRSEWSHRRALQGQVPPQEQASPGARRGRGRPAACPLVGWDRVGRSRRAHRPPVSAARRLASRVAQQQVLSCSKSRAS